MMEEKAYDFHDLIDEYIEKDLYAFQKLYLEHIKIKNVLIMGELIPELYYKINPQKLPQTTISVEKKIFRKKLLFSHHDAGIANVDFCDSMAAEFADKKMKLHPQHDFTQDILSSSEMIARKYHVDMDHVENVQTLALQFFDRIRKLHGLGKRERLLLQISVILHSCGLYIDSIDSRECSYQIIMSTEIIGLSHKERAMIAHIVRYNSEAFPSYGSFQEDFSKQEYISMTKLNSILRIANVLDKSNRHKIKSVSVTLKNDQLIVTADTMADITLEQGLFNRKALAFQNIFGIKPVLRQKRSGKRG